MLINFERSEEFGLSNDLLKNRFMVMMYWKSCLSFFNSKISSSSAGITTLTLPLTAMLVNADKFSAEGCAWCFSPSWLFFVSLSSNTCMQKEVYNFFWLLCFFWSESFTQPRQPSYINDIIILQFHFHSFWACSTSIPKSMFYPFLENFTIPCNFYLKTCFTCLLVYFHLVFLSSMLLVW